MKFTENNASIGKEILKFDHYVAMAYTVPDTGVTVNPAGKKIVKAGTILPSNDANAKGVLLYDVDVSYGAAPGALVIHGFIDGSKIPVEPDVAAKTALSMIMFL